MDGLPGADEQVVDPDLHAALRSHLEGRVKIKRSNQIFEYLPDGQEELLPAPTTGLQGSCCSLDRGTSRIGCCQRWTLGEPARDVDPYEKRKEATCIV